jgi:hypothetical protein
MRVILIAVPDDANTDFLTEDYVKVLHETDSNEEDLHYHYIGEI